MEATVVRVEGLDKFIRGLRQMDRDLPKQIKVVMNEAAQLVVDRARPRVPRRSGRAAASIRVASTRSKARVRAGGARVPYYPWLDFGGAVGRSGSVRRPFLKEGRYLWKAIGELRSEGKIQQVLSRSLVDLGRQAGIEVT